RGAVPRRAKRSAGSMSTLPVTRTSVGARSGAEHRKGAGGARRIGLSGCPPQKTPIGAEDQHRWLRPGLQAANPDRIEVNQLGRPELGRVSRLCRVRHARSNAENSASALYKSGFKAAPPRFVRGAKWTADTGAAYDHAILPSRPEIHELPGQRISGG